MQNSSQKKGWFRLKKAPVAAQPDSEADVILSKIDSSVYSRRAGRNALDDQAIPVRQQQQQQYSDENVSDNGGNWNQGARARSQTEMAPASFQQAQFVHPVFGAQGPPPSIPQPPPPLGYQAQQQQREQQIIAQQLAHQRQQQLIFHQQQMEMLSMQDRSLPRPPADVQRLEQRSPTTAVAPLQIVVKSPAAPEMIDTPNSAIETPVLIPSRLAEVAQQPRSPAPLDAPPSVPTSPQEMRGSRSSIPRRSLHTGLEQPRQFVRATNAFLYAPPAPLVDDESTPQQISSLAEHLFSNGFSRGFFADLSLHILGNTYHVHRIVLSRFPFFARMFFGDGAEFAGVADDEVEIEVNDVNMSPEGVEIVLASLYGLVCPIKSEPVPGVFAISSANVLQVLASAYFFQHYSLMEYCMDFILSCHLSPHKYRDFALEKFSELKSVETPTSPDIIIRLISFIDRFDYGPEITERIEDALLNYLCVEGYTSLEELFISIPLQWLERVIEADAFWCPNEFARYSFAKGIVLQRKLRNLQRTQEENGDGQRSCDEVYTDIFKYAVIYTHMTFEQLNEVRSDNLVPEAILMKSLWHQTRFRSTIEGMPENQVSVSVSGDGSAKGSDTDAKAASNAPIRLGVEFSDIHKLQEGERKYSSTFFYGGSWWTIFLQKFLAPLEEGEKEQRIEKWGIFLRRSEGSSLSSMAKASGEIPAFDGNKLGVYKPDTIVDPVTGLDIEKSVSYYNDKRKHVTAVFKLFNPVLKCYDPVFESKANDYMETQSWGYRSQSNIVTKNDLNVTNDPKIRFTLVMKFI